MRSLMFLAPALLAACANVPASPAAAEQSALPQQPAARGETPGHTCNASGTDRFIGQPATDETGAAIQAATNAAILRWARPGVMLTMDFRADRVTVRVDPGQKVTQISCG